MPGTLYTAGGLSIYRLAGGGGVGNRTRAAVNAVADIRAAGGRGGRARRTVSAVASTTPAPRRRVRLGSVGVLLGSESSALLSRGINVSW